ncbi:retrotransposon protein, putative, ty1-copia subclass [Tanacetum coccineum]
MVRSMMSQTTLSKCFWDYALESAARILNMVPTKKALVKRDTLTKPDKLEPRSIKCIFVGYPKEPMGYSFYYPPENKVFVARNAEFFENSLIIQEAIGDLNEPANYKASLLDLEFDKWLKAMNVEMQSMKDNKVWDLVDLPPNEKTIDSKCLFKKKTNIDGAIHTYKARFVAKGFTQTTGIDYEETFSPVADIRAIRILIAIDVFYDYEIWQMNVKTAFLNRYLSEEEASRQWNKRFDDEIKKFRFTQNRDEPYDVKSYLRRCFAMKDLGEAAYILGIKIYRDRLKRLIDLCQSAYIKKILKRYFMENFTCGSILMQEKLKLSKSQGASTPAEVKRMQNLSYASAVGSIMYDVRCTHPDVAFAQNITSRFQHNPGELHWTVVQNILKYLCNTKDMFLAYGGDIKRELRVSCYTDTGYLTDADDLKSQTGYVFVLNGEAEYIAASDASKEAVWARKFIYKLGVVPTVEEPIKMYRDNTRAITIANESGITKGARHYRAKVYYLREVKEYGDVKLEKVHTDDNLVDPFTKALAFPKHSEHTKNIRMLPTSNLM